MINTFTLEEVTIRYFQIKNNCATFTQYTKINKINQRFKCKTPNHKTLEENIGNKLFDISLSNMFQDMSSRKKTTKAKMNM